MLQDLLRLTRKQAGLTQQDVADLLGVDRAYVSRMESGPPTAAVRRLEEAFEALGVALQPVPRSLAGQPPPPGSESPSAAVPTEAQDRP